MISLHTQKLYEYAEKGLDVGKQSDGSGKSGKADYRIYEDEFLKRACIRMMVSTEYKLNQLNMARLAAIKHNEGKTEEEYITTLCESYTGSVKFDIYQALVGIYKTDTVIKPRSMENYFVIPEYTGNEYNGFVRKFDAIHTSFPNSDRDGVVRIKPGNRYDSEGGKLPTEVMSINRPDTIKLSEIEGVWMAIVRYLDVLSDAVLKRTQNSMLAKKPNKADIILGLLRYVVLSKPNRIYGGNEYDYGGYYRPFFTIDNGIPRLIDNKKLKETSSLLTEGIKNSFNNLIDMGYESYFYIKDGSRETVAEMARYIVADDLENIGKSYSEYLHGHSCLEIVRDFYILLTARSGTQGYERLLLFNRAGSGVLTFNQAVCTLFGKEEDGVTDLPKRDNITKIITEDKFRGYFPNARINDFDDWLSGKFETPVEENIRSIFVKSEYQIPYDVNSKSIRLIENTRSIEMLKFLSSQPLLQGTREKVQVAKDTYGRQYRRLKRFQRQISLSNNLVGKGKDIAGTINEIIRGLDSESISKYKSINNFLFFNPFSEKIPDSNGSNIKILDSAMLTTKFAGIDKVLNDFLSSESEWISILQNGSNRLEQFCKWCVKETMKQFVDELRCVIDILNWNLDIDFDKLESRLSSEENIRICHPSYDGVLRKEKIKILQLSNNFSVPLTSNPGRAGTIYDTMRGQKIRMFNFNGTSYFNNVKDLKFERGDFKITTMGGATSSVTEVSDASYKTFYVVAKKIEKLNDYMNVLVCVSEPSKAKSSRESVSMKLYAPIIMDDLFSNRMPVNKFFHDLIQQGNKVEAASFIGNNAMLIGIQLIGESEQYER